MDFRGQGNHAPNAPAPQQGQNSGTFNSNAARPVSKRGAKRPIGKLAKVGGIVFILGLAALLMALTLFLIFGKGSSESQIDKDKYQAVFLNNGQVYFGKVKSYGREAVDLQDIYYLQTSNSSTETEQSQTPSNVSLVKLGCELHAPVDQMLINTEQVIFWENLTDDGQVAKAISQYKTENNGKLNCSQQSQTSTDQAPANSTTKTTPTTTPTTTKP